MTLSELNSQLEEQINDTLGEIIGEDMDESDFFDLCDAAVSVLNFNFANLVQPGQGISDADAREKEIQRVRAVVANPDSLKAYLNEIMRGFLAEKKFDNSKLVGFSDMINSSVDEYFESLG